MKDIKGYEGQYAITSCGKVWSYKSKKFLSPGRCRNGYYQVGLCKNNVKKHYVIHRLVAEAYIPNPENKPQINHKDEDKSNNALPNLEWVTAKENINYGTRNKRASKKIYCVELDKVFDSLTSTSKELGLSIGNISSVCSGRRYTAGGYHFKYFEENEDELS